MRYSDSKDLNRCISETSLRRREQCRLDIMVYIGIDRRSNGNDKIKLILLIRSLLCASCVLIAAKMVRYLYSVSEQSRHTS